MTRGDVVETPGGVGRFWDTDGDTAVVEMDNTYLVGYPAGQVRPYKEVKVNDSTD
jgi:hypothetical protein